MRILKPTPANLKHTARLIKAGGVIVYPTDTAYAIGGRFDSPAVVRRILRIKGRSDRKFTLVAASPRQASKYFPQLRASRYMLHATRHWPGPLSIVVSPRLAVRVPANSLTRKLCQLAGTPLIATSANISGQPSCYSVSTFLRQTKKNRDMPDLILDAGRLPHRPVSTIAAVRRGRIVVIRQGSVRL